jgi:hypothetical protein
VPSATNADKVDGRDAGDFVSRGDYRRVVVKLQAGDLKEIVRNGPVSVYARCVQTGGNDQIQMFAKTEVNRAVLHATWGDVLNGGPAASDFLNTTTPEAQREWENSNTDPTNNTQAIAPSNETKLVDRYDDNHVIAPTGQAISWESESSVLALNLAGARCLIAGDVHIYNLGG